MAHLPPSAAIFSPSVARAAASAAKDWAYVDGWLQRKFPGRDPPPFERNADTLRALLALASANEAADEERALVARLEAETLEQLRRHEQRQSSSSHHSSSQNQPTSATTGTGTGPDESTTTTTTTSTTTALDDAREAILASLESSLTREGQAALEAMAGLAVQWGMGEATPAGLGGELVRQAAEGARLEQAQQRTEALAAYIGREAERTAELAAEMRPRSPSAHHQAAGGDPLSDDGEEGDGDPSSSSALSMTTTAAATKQAGAGGTGYHAPPTLARENLATQRRIKALAARIPELRSQATALANAVTAAGTGSGATSPSIEQVRQEEEAYLALLAEKKELDGQVRAFQGLPPDTELARQELEGLREELRRMTLRRDEVFEGLVERESPRKGPARRG